MLSEKSVLRSSTNCTWKELGGSVVILQSDISPPVTHELNKTGSFVWVELQHGDCDFSDLLNKILGEFEVDENIAKSDLLELLKNLKEKKLIWSLD